MKHTGILDTGPLVALLNKQDAYHAWSLEQSKLFRPPMLTCEPVITEALFLLQRYAPEAVNQVFELFHQGLLAIPFQLETETHILQQVMRQYSNLPASLADTCLLRMAELLPRSLIFTLDSDFEIYRIHRSQPVPHIRPGR